MMPAPEIRAEARTRYPLGGQTPQREQDDRDQFDLGFTDGAPERTDDGSQQGWHHKKSSHRQGCEGGQQPAVGGE